MGRSFAAWLPHIRNRLILSRIVYFCDTNVQYHAKSCLLYSGYIAISYNLIKCQYCPQCLVIAPETETTPFIKISTPRLLMDSHYWGSQNLRGSIQITYIFSVCHLHILSCLMRREQLFSSNDMELKYLWSAAAIKESFDSVGKNSFWYCCQGK